ncbi:MAG: SUMF1/EgtB/PvdO family nonheme iron enzyme [Polyangiaceae bacterium]
MRRTSWQPFALSAGLALVAVVAVVVVLSLAQKQRTAPQRCPPGLELGATRCCGEGQREVAGHCEGTPQRCAVNMTVTKDGCVAQSRRVAIPAGRFELSVADWEPNMSTGRRVVDLPAFLFDSHEVSVAAYARCVAAGACAAIDATNTEPGVPVRGASAEHASKYCAWAGGRVPTVDEWLAAAMGSDARRFPWGPTGLVCRRASFGLVAGPCAVGGSGPELTGARPDGATPDGVVDLAGNVAEWARTSTGGFVALGGSFASRLAAELKPAARPVEAPPLDHMGFRCAYSSAR